jgi:hypothetical protein
VIGFEDVWSGEERDFDSTLVGLQKITNDLGLSTSKGSGRRY